MSKAPPDFRSQIDAGLVGFAKAYDVLSIAIAVVTLGFGLTVAYFDVGRTWADKAIGYAGVTALCLTAARGWMLVATRKHRKAAERRRRIRGKVDAELARRYLSRMRELLGNGHAADVLRQVQAATEREVDTGEMAPREKLPAFDNKEIPDFLVRVSYTLDGRQCSTFFADDRTQNDAAYAIALERLYPGAQVAHVERRVKPIPPQPCVH